MAKRDTRELTGAAEDEVELAIGYEGEAVASRRMAVDDLAPAMLGVAKLIEESAATIAGVRGTIRVEVKADFRHGSFVFDIVAVAQQTGQIVSGLWGNVSLLELAMFIGIVGRDGLIQLRKRLRNRRVTSIERNGPRSLFTLEDGAVEIVDTPVAELYQNPAVQEQLERATGPLRKPGYDSFFARSPGRIDVVEVTRDEADYFLAPPPPETVLQDNVRREIVQVIAPNFKEGNKWVVALAGDRPFHVSILDKQFLDRVRRHEVTFGRGDALLVRMRTQVTRNGEGDFARLREIVEVNEYIRADRVVQDGLFDFAESGEDGAGSAIDILADDDPADDSPYDRDD